MTDQELLEMAAKAIGLEHEGYANPACGDYYHPRDGDAGLRTSFDVKNESSLCDGSGAWNPLTNDGDALRLAVNLRMNVFHAVGAAYSLPSDDDGDFEKVVSYRDAGGPEKATRKAIVLCAAEIGKDML